MAIGENPDLYRQTDDPESLAQERERERERAERNLQWIREKIAYRKKEGLDRIINKHQDRDRNPK